MPTTGASKFNISSSAEWATQEELVAALLPEVPDRNIEVVTSQFLRLNEIGRFQWGSEAQVFTKADWPFVFKILEDDPESDIWAFNTLRSYQIAKTTCGGLIADFSLCGYAEAARSGSLEPAVVMKKSRIG